MLPWEVTAEHVLLGSRTIILLGSSGRNRNILQRSSVSYFVVAIAGHHRAEAPQVSVSVVTVGLPKLCSVVLSG